MKNSTHHIMVPVQSKTRRGELGLSAGTSKLFGEWQQRGPEAFSGFAFRKLRLTLAPPQSAAAANARG
jgi:hypothetical protein